MKRILSTLALVALGVFPATSQASLGARWLVEPINFRKTGATVIPDSAWVYSKASQGSDTTQAFAVASLPLVFNPGEMPGTAAADSTTWFGFYLGQATTTAPAIDSVYVGMQVSMDGANWTAVTPVSVFFAASTIPPIDSAVLIEVNSSNTVGRLYESTNLATSDLVGTLTGATKPTERAIFGYNFVRWIVTWGTEAAQPMGAWVGHWARGE